MIPSSMRARAAAVAGALVLAICGQAAPSKGKPAARPRPTLPVLSGKEAVRRCTAAYRNLQSYQGTTRVSEQLGKARGEFRAFIRYQSPGQFHITGNEAGGWDYTIVVDGKASWVRKHDTGNKWLRSENPIYHIATMAMPTYGAASSIPALLVEQDMLSTLEAYPKLSPRAAEVMLNGRRVYRVDAKSDGLQASFWIDPKTFLLVEKRTSTIPKANPARKSGTPIVRGHRREVYQGVQIDKPLPSSLFAKPYDAP